MALRTVKIFIASSDELTPERDRFDTLLARINHVYKARGVRLEAVRWEFLDSSMGIEHKQAEYNREVRDCDICVVMFWQKFGEYTNTELKVADTELRAGRKPNKIYVFCKEPGDMSSDLLAFKQNFEKEYGHFYGKFDCVDKLQLDFILQLELFLNSDIVKVENSQVKIDDVVIAHLDNIGFAAGNDKYKSLREELEQLETRIAKTRKRLEKCPDDEDFQDDLNEYLSKRNKLREELDEHEQVLLNAAVRVAQFAGERISARMKRAIDLFEQGKVSEANTVLDEAEHDADEILRGVKEFKSAGKQSVDELKVKASYMLADTTYPIEERIEKSEAIYDKAIELARECNYEAEKYDALLFDYAEFLSKYGKYAKALEKNQVLITLREQIYGYDHPSTADVYGNLGIVY